MSKPVVRKSIVMLAIVAALGIAVSFWHRESPTPKRRAVSHEDIYFWANKSDAPFHTDLWQVYAHYREATDRSYRLGWSSNNQEGESVYADMEAKKLYGAASNPSENAYDYHLLGSFSMSGHELTPELPAGMHVAYAPSRRFTSDGVVYLLTSDTTKPEFQSQMMRESR